MNGQQTCHYCERPGQLLMICCDSHPDNMVCADVAACRDALLDRVRAQDQAAEAAQAAPVTPRLAVSDQELQRIEVCRSAGDVVVRCTADNWTLRRERTDLGIIVHDALTHLAGCTNPARSASGFRLVDGWQQLAPDLEPGQQTVTWAATAEAHAAAPLMHLRVFRQANGRYVGQISYDYDPEGDVWSQDGFESRQGAIAWAEMKVQALGGGGGR